MLAYVTWLASLRFPRAPLLFPPPNVPCVWAPGKGHNSGPVEKQTAEGPHPRPAETTVHISAQGTSDTLQTPVPPLAHVRQLCSPIRGGTLGCARVAQVG